MVFLRNLVFLPDKLSFSEKPSFSPEKLSFQKNPVFLAEKLGFSEKNRVYLILVTFACHMSLLLHKVQGLADFGEILAKKKL